MTNNDYRKYLDAVDVVCDRCTQISEENCESCPVRITADFLARKAIAEQPVVSGIELFEAPAIDEFVTHFCCDVCGKPITCGMTTDDGDFHVCESCFPAFMDRKYGEHKWMSLGNGADDGCGGYYIVSDDNEEEGFSGTGIYYTEFEQD